MPTASAGVEAVESECKDPGKDIVESASATSSLNQIRLLESNSYRNCLSATPTCLYHGLRATAVSWKEKKIVLNNAGKGAEEDYL